LPTTWSASYASRARQSLPTSSRASTGRPRKMLSWMGTTTMRNTGWPANQTTPPFRQEGKAARLGGNARAERVRRHWLFFLPPISDIRGVVLTTPVGSASARVQIHAICAIVRACNQHRRHSGSVVLDRHSRHLNQQSVPMPFALSHRATFGGRSSKLSATRPASGTSSWRPNLLGSVAEVGQQEVAIKRQAMLTDATPERRRPCASLSFVEPLLALSQLERSSDYF
jgi:hypothetical protein